MKESEVIELYQSAANYEEQQAVINSTEYPGKTKYMLIKKGIYQKKTTESAEKVALLNAFALVTGENMPSLKNMTMRDLKKLWRYIIRENDRLETK